MAILQISYSELSKASKQANKSARQLENYSSSLTTGITRKISSISGGVSSLTQNALDITNQKINKLNEKATKLYDFSKKIDTFKEKVRETDKSVAKTINIQSDIFARHNNVRKGILYTILQGIVTEAIDKCPFKEWVKATYYVAKNKFNDFKTDIKRWWKTGGGKYIGDIALSVLAIGVAIVTILTAGTGLLALITIIAGAITILNGVTNIIYSYKAYSSNNDNPSWAHRYGKMDKYSDKLRSDGEYEMAAVLDLTEGITTLVVAGTSLTKLGAKFKDFLGNKGFVSIKQLFGSSNNGSVGKLGSKFMIFKDDKWKFSANSIFNGAKTFISEGEYRKSLSNSVRLFGDEIVDLCKYNKMNIKQGGVVVKELIKGDTFKKNRAKDIIKNLLF